ncbi:MAG: hypothetical protein QM778_04575 [Myxococcales bacterium]
MIPSSVPPASGSRFAHDGLAFARTPGSQLALARFSRARSFVLVCLLFGALAATQVSIPQGEHPLLVAFGLCCLALLTEQLARACLIRELALEARNSGLSASTARHHASAFLSRILRDYMP